MGLQRLSPLVVYIVCLVLSNTLPLVHTQTAGASPTSQSVKATTLAPTTLTDEWDPSTQLPQESTTTDDSQLLETTITTSTAAPSRTTQKVAPSTAQLTTRPSMTTRITTTESAVPTTKTSKSTKPDVVPKGPSTTKNIVTTTHTTPALTTSTTAKPTAKPTSGLTTTEKTKTTAAASTTGRRTTEIVTQGKSAAVGTTRERIPSTEKHQSEASRTTQSDDSSNPVVDIETTPSPEASKNHTHWWTFSENSLVSKLMVPVILGVVAAVVIVCFAYSVRACKRRKRSHRGHKLIQNGKDHELGGNFDRMKLLADSSEDEF